MAKLKFFHYFFLLIVFVLSSFVHSGDEDIYEKLSSADPTEQIATLRDLQQPNKDVNIHIQVMALALFSDSRAVRRAAIRAFKRIFNNTVNFSLEDQQKLVDIATSNEVNDARKAAGSVLMRIPSLHLDTQQELVRLATSDTVSETARSTAKEILMKTGFLHSIVQMGLLQLTTFSGVSETTQNTAKEIVLGRTTSFDSEVQQDLVRLATSDSDTVSEMSRTRSKKILIEMEVLDSGFQQELVRLATSDSNTVSEISQTRAREILIELPSLDLEVQQQLVRIANSNVVTKDVRVRARNILSQLKNIHPEIAKGMGFSLRCRRAFRRLVPAFGVAQ